MPSHTFSRSLIVRASLTAVLVVVLASPVLAGKGKQSAFQVACTDFAKLLRRNDCPREQWLQLIRKFAVLHKQATDPAERARSLLLAGKAALDLYKRSARVEDLELSIRTLQRFCRTCRSSPELHHGVRLLGEAQAISEGLKKRPAENFVASVSPHPIPESPPASPWSQTAARAPIPAEVPAPTQRPSVQSPVLPESPTGNPYCPTGQRSLFRIPLPERHAAVPRRIVTDVPSRAVPQAPPARQFIVVIDPGHGGKDPGAVSADGRLKEKDITLKVGLDLKKILERANPRVSVLLTRDRDVFVTLKDRKTFAHSVNADLFISIHCNSSTESVANGIETYYFSTASSRRAMALAARENRSSSDGDMEIRTLRLAGSQSIAAASNLAELIHRGVMEKLGETVARGRDRGVKSGPFHILHATKMPAILLECSFISNPAERAKLKDPAYLHRLAEGIAGGAQKYLRDLGEKG